MSTWLRTPWLKIKLSGVKSPRHSYCPALRLLLFRHCTRHPVPHHQGSQRHFRNKREVGAKSQARPLAGVSLAKWPTQLQTQLVSSASWDCKVQRYVRIRTCKVLLMKLGLLGQRQMTRPSTLQQSKKSVAEYSGAVRTTSVAISADEAQPHRIAKHSAMTESALGVSSDENGLSRSRASGMTSAAATAAVKSAGEVRPLGLTQYCAP